MDSPVECVHLQRLLLVLVSLLKVYVFNVDVFLTFGGFNGTIVITETNI